LGINGVRRIKLITFFKKKNMINKMASIHDCNVAYRRYKSIVESQGLPPDIIPVEEVLRANPVIDAAYDSYSSICAAAISVRSHASYIAYRMYILACRNAGLPPNWSAAYLNLLTPEERKGERLLYPRVREAYAAYFVYTATCSNF
jgi:hypothetical protein